ncbi:MAG: zeta toxin family protein [bacterium]
MISLNHVISSSNKMKLLTTKSTVNNTTQRCEEKPHFQPSNVSSLQLRNALISQNLIQFKSHDQYDHNKYLTHENKKTISDHLEILSNITTEERGEAELLFELQKDILKEKVLHFKDQIIYKKMEELSLDLKNPKHEHKAYVITGCSTAGKSTIVEEIIEKTNCLLIDQDVAKANLPEDIVISEKAKRYGSALLGSKGSDLLNEIIDEESEKGTNICCPTGCNKADLTNIIDKLSNKGYDIELIYVRIDPHTAMKRLMGRIENGRFTRAEKVMDELKNSEILINNILKKDNGSIKNYTIIDNNPTKPSKPILISSHGIGIEPEKGKGGIIERSSLVKITPEEEINIVKSSTIDY